MGQEKRGKMQNIILVSKCLKLSKFSTTEILSYHFHFKGHCAGSKISSVEVRASHDNKLAIGREYLMLIKFLQIKKGILIGALIEGVLLEDINLYSDEPPLDLLS